MDFNITDLKGETAKCKIGLRLKKLAMTLTLSANISIGKKHIAICYAEQKKLS